jgi:hypothetical protein
VRSLNPLLSDDLFEYSNSHVNTGRLIEGGNDPVVVQEEERYQDAVLGTETTAFEIENSSRHRVESPALAASEGGELWNNDV